MSVDFALDYPFRAPQVCPLSEARRTARRCIDEADQIQDKDVSSQYRF